MYFIFIMTSALGGFMAARGFLDGDIGKAFLGLLFVAVSVIANGYIGLPS